LTGRLDDLDDPDYPAYTTGRAAEVLGVQQAFLRSLDAAGAVSPARSAGGRRRYTRRQLAVAERVRELFDDGCTLAAALRILALEDDLAAERALAAGTRRKRLSGHRLLSLEAIRNGCGDMDLPGSAWRCRPASGQGRVQRGRCCAPDGPGPGWALPSARARSAASSARSWRVSSCSSRMRLMPARFSPSAVSAQISCSRLMSLREYRRVPPALRAGSSNPSRS
jgi:DNA-binding transcriptional MerR regulator